MANEKILREKTVFDDFLVLQEAEIDRDGKTYSRLRLKRVDASAVLLYNTSSRKVILTRQFRYAIHEKSPSPVIEIVAGKIDEGEEPLVTAIRECEEETGYRPAEENIRLLSKVFVSPGYTSERFYIYFATVTDEDRKGRGGGLAEENESIEVLEMDKEEFEEMVRSGKADDAKTCAAALHVMLLGLW